MMYCSVKCSKKDLSIDGVVERKCKVCKKKFKSRFIAICSCCQFKKIYCIACGKLIEKEVKNNAQQ